MHPRSELRKLCGNTKTSCTNKVKITVSGIHSKNTGHAKKWENTTHNEENLKKIKAETKKCWCRCGKIGTLITVSGNIKCCSHFFLKKWRIELPLLGTYPKELKAWYWRDVCTPIFIAVLFTIVKIWKQHRCPSVDEQTTKTWSIHRMECYSALKRKVLLFFGIFIYLLLL